MRDFCGFVGRDDEGLGHEPALFTRWGEYRQRLVREVRVERGRSYIAAVERG